MGIPETQLAVWSLQGATTRANETYESVRAALGSLRAGSTETYLQGSYANGTNIRADGTVDVVVQLNAPTADPFTYAAFRREILSVLRSRYHLSTVGEGKLSLKVRDQETRLPADIVVGLKCVDPRECEGIWLTTPDGAQVINYPKQHIGNGARKDDETGGWYRRAVREFKNVRDHLIKDGILEKGAAPSYFLECLIYNVPSEKFGPTHQDTFCNCVNWLMEADLPSLKCQNGRQDIFNSNGSRWKAESARKFLEAVGDLWSRW
jgi:hypothetical protein